MSEINPEAESGFLVDHSTEPVFGFPAGPAVLHTHGPDRCAGEHCVIHNPSDHHMREWETNWRSDLGVMERLCPQHGIGHPDPDDVAYQKSQGNHWANIHGCCGCCTGEPETVSAKQIMEHAGLTHRQVDHWTSKGYLLPVGDPNPGHGIPRAYPAEELGQALVMASLIRAGLRPSMAAMAAREIRLNRTWECGPVQVSVAKEDACCSSS